MKQTLFIVELSTGHQDHWYAFSAIEAVIQAMGAAIKDGRNHNVDFVENAETKERFSVNHQIRLSAV